MKGTTTKGTITKIPRNVKKSTIARKRRKEESRFSLTHKKARDLGKEAFSHYPLDVEKGIDFMEMASAGDPDMLHLFARAGMRCYYHGARGNKIKNRKGLKNDEKPPLPTMGPAGLQRQAAIRSGKSMPTLSKAAKASMLEMERRKIMEWNLPGVGTHLWDSTGLELDFSIGSEAAKMDGHQRNVEFFSRIRERMSATARVRDAWHVDDLIALRDEIWKDE